MASHQFEGLAAYFEKCGEGPNVLLLHAGGSSGAQWRKSATLLGADYRLFITSLSNLADPTTLEDCRTIRINALVLSGEKTTEPDRVVTEIPRRELPNNSYQVLPDVEHMSPLTHPEQLAAAIKTHLT